MSDPAKDDKLFELTERLRVHCFEYDYPRSMIINGVAPFAEAIPTWISFYSIPPDNNSTIDVIAQFIESTDGMKTQKRLTNCWFRDGDILQARNGDMVRIFNATHWMYVPNKPPLV